jgi:transcriptional regulator with XRE-family HTH domain
MKRHAKSKPTTVLPEAAFAKALREIRTEHGVSQETLGLDAGYHRTYISLLERGKMNPTLRTILSIAAVLGIPARDIVERVERHLGGPWKKEPGDDDLKRVATPPRS